MIHYVDVKVGDSVVITAVEAQPEPPEPEELLPVLLQIGDVKIYTNDAGSYVYFTSNLDICNDGSGPDYDDPHHQSQTAYYSGGKQGGKYLNADVDRYIVVPPQIRSSVPGVVMGCRGQVTNLKTGVIHQGVVGEIGPNDKTGETAYCLAKLLNQAITHNSGDDDPSYFYELWPGQPATVDDFTYKLQPA